MSTLSVEDAQEIVWGEHVARQLVAEYRWSNVYLIVFDDDGTLRGFLYDEPATEMQEGMDSFTEDPVPTFEVVAKEVTTTVYERV